MKKSLLLVIAVVFGCLTSFAQTEPATPTTTGTCGEKLNWTYDAASKTLNITGTGAMNDFTNQGETPWVDFKDVLTKVVIEDGCTTIGQSAFMAYSKISSVTIPASVKTIGGMAFFMDQALKTINLPEGIETIKFSAFMMSGLTSVVIPSTVKSIESRAFFNIKSLETVEIKALVPPTIVEESFTAGVNLIIPESAIDAYKKDPLWNTLIEASATKIPLEGKCGKNLTWKLDTVADVLTISGTGDMDDYYEDEGRPWFEAKEEIKTIVVEEGCTSLGRFSFHTCPNVESVKLPNSIKSIGDMAFMNFFFMNKSKLTSIVIPNGLKYLGESAFYGTGLKSITIPESVDTLRTGCFMACDALAEVKMPETLKVIGMNVFNKCISITSFVVPASVDSIGSGAFLSLPLTRFELKSLVPPVVGGDPFNNSFGEQVFPIFEFVYPKESEKQYSTDPYWGAWFTTAQGNCGKLDAEGNFGANLTWALKGNGDLVISGSGLMGDSKKFTLTPWVEHKEAIKSVIIEKGCTYVGKFAFHTIPNLEYVYLPETVTEIGDMAFQAVSKTPNKLTSISLPKSITKIGISAFMYCPLKSIKLPKKLEVLSTGVFMNCQSLEKVTLSDSLRVIGMNAFNKCKALQTLVVPEKVDSIGKGAFAETNFTTFEIKALVPPTVEENPFDKATVDFEFVVPEAALDAYKADAYWKQFIKDTATDVEENEVSNVVVYRNGNSLVIEGSTSEFNIYTVSGVMVYSGHNAVVELPKGMYIIKGEDFCEKVIL